MNDKVLTTTIDDVVTTAIKNKTLKDVKSISMNSDTLMELSLSGTKLFVNELNPTYRGFAIVIDENLAKNQIRLNYID